jgi:ubiquinone/menaquinone biosynthesis C-methylase UbiE
MKTKNAMVKRINILKFKHFTTYAWIHGGSYNIFERLFIRKTLENNSSKGKFAIDVGCGLGLVLKEMHHIYDYCIGIDISLDMLRETKISLKRWEKRSIDLLCADIEHMPFKDSVFDVADMYSVLHHLPNIHSSLKEVNRIMKLKSPLIIFHEPNEIHTRRVFEKTLLRILGRMGTIFLRSIHKRKWLQAKQESHRRFMVLGRSEKLADIYSEKGFSSDHMRNLLEEAGFEVIQIKTRIQSFMTVFSRLYWPYKMMAVLDFAMSEVPVLRNYLPLLFCIAKKSLTINKDKSRGFICPLLLVYTKDHQLLNTEYLKTNQNAINI